MRRFAPLLILGLACQRPRPPLVQTSPMPLRVLGDVNPDSMPPSCRAHGGTSPVRSAPPLWTRSARPERALDSLDSGRLLIHLTAARTGESLQTGAIYLEAFQPSRRVQGYLADGGWARLQAPAGRYALRVRSIGVGEGVLDSLDVRRGFADTLRLAVGQPWFCGL